MDRHGQAYPRTPGHGITKIIPTPRAVPCDAVSLLGSQLYSSRAQPATLLNATVNLNSVARSEFGVNGQQLGKYTNDAFVLREQIVLVEALAAKSEFGHR